MKKLIVDLDHTLSITTNGDYVNSKPISPMIETLVKYKELGFEIVINSSRNMRTYGNNVGKINVHTLPNIVEWLNKHEIPYDEVYIGKPWCGFEGFYIDDKSIRPSEFLNYSYDEIEELLRKEKEAMDSLV
ncbi:MAG: capsular biosynthesis protein [Flavobacteriaceae bacterium]|nr:capsular biosynthesis protein [Flavobacteriaceae bacterium]